MISADTLRNKADRRRFEAYLVIGRLTASYGAVSALRAQHLTYLHQLQEGNILILAGPTLTDEGSTYRGDGCFVIAASDLAVAKAIAFDDPYHRQGARTNDVIPWLISEGRLFDAVNLIEPKASR